MNHSPCNKVPPAPLCPQPAAQQSPNAQHRGEVAKQRWRAPATYLAGINPGHNNVTICPSDITICASREIIVNIHGYGSARQMILPRKCSGSVPVTEQEDQHSGCARTRAAKQPGCTNNLKHSNAHFCRHRKVMGPGPQWSSCNICIRLQPLAPHDSNHLLSGQALCLFPPWATNVLLPISCSAAGPTMGCCGLFRTSFPKEGWGVVQGLGKDTRGTSHNTINVWNAVNKPAFSTYANWPSCKLDNILQ